MKKPIFLWFFVLLLSISVVWAEESPILVGKVIDIDGRVLMTNRLTESSWYQGFTQMPTFLKERLKTDSATSATVQFYIGGRAVISPDTQVELVTMESLRVVKVTSGTVWAKVDKQDKELQIQTAGGVIGIEGTEFFVETDQQGETKLTVIEGRVRVRTGDEDKVVTDGEAMEFRRGVKRLQRFADASKTTPKQRRKAAFKRLGLEGKPFARYITTRGLSKRKKRRLLTRLFSRSSALPRSAKRRGNRRISKRAGRFQIKQLTQSDGALAASWVSAPTESYSVLLSTDEAGDDPVWHLSTSETSLTYPRYGPELEARDSYYLSVTPLRPDGRPYEINGQPVTAQTAFVAAGHHPGYGAISDVQVTAKKGLPKIMWSADDSAGGHLVSILRGEQIVWQDETEGSSYTYPATARSLKPGAYQVLVESSDKSGFKKAESSLYDFETQGWQAEGLEGPPRL